MTKSPMRILIASALTLIGLSLPARAQTGGPEPLSPNGVAASSRIYLPIVLLNGPAGTAFGIEAANFTVNAVDIAATGATYARRNALQWGLVETSQGQRNWAAVAALENDLRAASAAGLKLDLIIRFTPSWAQQSGKACGPIRPDKLAAFGNFVSDAVARYSKAPYNVKLWELWNEPDVDTAGQPSNEPFGCWGNLADPYFGGRYYAEMLKTAYPRIKQADPNAEVLLGGLLLDCAPGFSPCGGGPTSANFFEGILIAGGGAAFDGVSFHAYDFMTGVTPGLYVQNGWSNSNLDGPLVIKKARALRARMAQYGVTGKFLINTEVGTICFGDFCRVNGQLQTYALTSNVIYLAQAYSAAIAEGLRAQMWYSYEGWFGTDMIAGSVKLPPYNAFKLARNKLGDVFYIGDVSQADVHSPGIKGYKFSRRGKQIWVLWSLDGSARNISLAGGPHLTRADGSAGSTSVTAMPVYVEFP